MRRVFYLSRIIFCVHEFAERDFTKKSPFLGFPAQFFDEPIDHDLLLFLGRFQCNDTPATKTVSL